MAETESAEQPVLYLARREEHRLRNGHPWVFSNEVDTTRSPLTAFEPGDQVEVLTHGERFLATAYVNPRSLICARVIGTRPGEWLDAAALESRLVRAQRMRDRLIGQPWYRLAYAESDDLPGLIVDRYGDIAVVQIGTAGMERHQGDIVDALRRTLAPAAIVARNDVATRALEGLEQTVEVLHGDAPGTIEVRENDLVFLAAPMSGQKTGWFFDQRDNRRRVAQHAAGRRVLDLFCYSGGFGVTAAAAGATEVVCVDSSEAALDLARAAARRNGVEARMSFVQADVFDALRAMAEDGRRFDLVVADPPAFVRRRKDLAAGVEAYRRLNRLAVSVLAPEALLLSASCSSHLARERLHEVVRAAAVRGGRSVQLLEDGGQALDHPVRLGMPESAYLKAALCWLA